MAGKKQHYIPKLLLRGFKVPGQRAELVVRYRRDLGQRQVSIDDICHSKYFYSTADDPTLDEAITRAESAAFGPAISAVRTDGTLTTEIETALRSFFAHLMIRTKTARSTLDAMAIAAASGVVDAVTDPSVVERMITANRIDVRKITKQALDEELASRGKSLDRNKRRVLQRLTEDQLRRRSGEASEYVAAKARSFLPPALAGVSGEHIQKKAMLESVAPERRIANLDRLTMRIVDFSDQEPLVLGDEPVVGFADDGAVLRPFTLFAAPQAYFLPVTPARAVVLYARSELALVPTTLINDASAALSHEQFVARSPAARFAELAQSIGSYRDPFKDIDWKAIASGETVPS